MSEDNHPNFHACKFGSDILCSYFECLRGGASIQNCPELEREFVEFIAKIEAAVDKHVEENKRRNTPLNRVKLN